MVRPLGRFDAPLHPRRELVLKRGPPAPDGRPRVCDPVHRVAGVFIASAGDVSKPPAPAPPFRIGSVAGTEWEEVQPRRRVPLLERDVWVRGRPNAGDRIKRTERTVFLADVGVHPGPTRQRLIAAEVHPAIGPLAFVAAIRGLAEDVEEVQELFDDPRPGVVLVADGEHAELLEKRLELFWRPVVTHPPKRLGQLGWAAPDDDVDRSFVGAINYADDPV